MAGRLILVHMLCRDIAFSHQAPEMQTVFTPCVAFRVVGTPIKHQNSKLCNSFDDRLKSNT